MKIDPNFFDHVNELLADHPASTTRWCSTVLHNKSVGGAPNSGHLCIYGPNKDSCVAVDLIFDSPEEFRACAKAAYEAGFMGIEADITNNHLHLDEVPRVWRVVHRGPNNDTPLDAWLTSEI